MMTKIKSNKWHSTFFPQLTQSADASLATPLRKYHLTHSIYATPPTLFWRNSTREFYNPYNKEFSVNIDYKSTIYSVWL